MKNFRELISNTPYVLIPAVVAFIATQPTIDLDLGWHLRYGEYLAKTGQVLRDNILSYTWPDYHWVPVSWGYDFLVYQLFTLFGFTGISVTGGLITLAIFLLITWPIKRFGFRELFVMAAILLFVAVILYSGGLRDQTISALMFTLMMIVKFRYKKLLWLLPLIFLVWANLHGGFVLGLIVLSVAWLTEGLLLMLSRWNKKLSIGSKSDWIRLGIIGAASFLTPLINPWGSRIYEGTIQHSTNVNLALIAEWQPIYNDLYDSLAVGLIVAFVLALAYFRKRLEALPFIAAFSVVTFFAFTAVRFVIPLGIMMVFFMAENVPKFEWQNVPNFLAKKKRLVSWILTGAVTAYLITDIFVVRQFIKLPDSRVWGMTWNTYCEILTECSEEITNIMAKDPPKGAGLHPFNMGGYLIWRTPQVKTFIDGRMPAWERNGETPPINDGDRIIYAKNAAYLFRQFDKDYHFNWAIVYPEAPIASYFDALVKSGQWQLIYGDKLFKYYVRKNQN